LAQDYFPLTKDEAIRYGYKWKDDEEKSHVEQSYKVPNNIIDVNDDILHEILVCKSCQKNYRIVPQEFKLLKKMTLPIPVDCYECRNSKRKTLINPMKLWSRKCFKCNIDIETSYEPGIIENVYCQECYMKDVY
jgi:hypothetical protein